MVKRQNTKVEELYPGMGFTVSLDPPEGGYGGGSKGNKSSATSGTKENAKSQIRGAQTERDSKSDATKGPVQGPFLSKSAHPEFANLRITDAGIKTILRQEGYRDKAYVDASGYSVGYGHFLGVGTQGKGTVITPQQGLAYLAQDLKKFEKQVSARIKVPITDDQFTALMSFAYNAGAGVLDKGIADKINSGNFEGAAAQINKYNKSRDAAGVLSVNKELVKRRAFETSLLLGKKGKS
jgi:lysozyme